MSGICGDDKMSDSKVLRTNKGLLQNERERECGKCGERYKTVEERKDARFEMKRLHREEIEKLEGQIKGYKELLNRAMNSVNMLLEVWVELNRKMEKEMLEGI